MRRLFSSTWFTILRYIFVRVVTIGITIVVGVFVTVLIANGSGQLDANVSQQVEGITRREIFTWDSRGDDTRNERYEILLEERLEDAGMNLSYWPRHMRWTFNSLKIGWGEMLFSDLIPGNEGEDNRDGVQVLILDHLPNTLLLVGVGYFFVFIIGIPTALYLSRKHGTFLDRLVAIFAPLSAIPSWVHGTLLILVFAVELRWLPGLGMTDIIIPKDKIEYGLMVARHMILPVLAIVLGLLFQLVYAWRTFFLIYSQEDYVELAKAQGLSPRRIERKYIFRPTAPYIITSFALTLANFWQTTTAVEVIFNWPGLGRLYIGSLPHFFDESMYQGEMVIAVAIVVVFAYMLGGIVLLLDIAYVLVDPRMRVGGNGHTLTLAKRKRGLFRKRRKAEERLLPKKRWFNPAEWKLSAKYWVGILREQGKAVRKVFKELIRFPSAVFGLSVIFLLVIGSVYAFVAMPYNEVAIDWYQNSVTGKTYVPRYAWPSWVNTWRSEKLLSTIVLDSSTGEFEKEWGTQASGFPKSSVTYTFDYDYQYPPEELYMYFQAEYEEKFPFVFITWTMPDGTAIELKGMAPPSGKRVDLLEFLPRKFSKLPDEFDFEAYEDHESKALGEGALYWFFSDQEQAGLVPQKGTYSVEIETLFFEDEGDLDSELVMLGNVFGSAGTDARRRDLLVPLLWGMPFALIFGLAGAVFTTVISIVFSAVGVWFGGWADAIIQRVAEATMILPVLAIGVLLYAIFNVSLWIVLAIVVVLNAFGSPIKTFRAAFLQVKEASYIEAARSYGATDRRIIFFYMIPRMIPVVIPQLVTLIPSYVFLEATLGLFNIKSYFPTWGKVIYEALRFGMSYGSRFWVLEPIALLLFTGFAFAMLGYALDRVLNPRLMDV